MNSKFFVYCLVIIKVLKERGKKYKITLLWKVKLIKFNMVSFLPLMDF